MYVRKNFAKLSDKDRAKYVSGVKKLKASGVYDQYVRDHLTATLIRQGDRSDQAHDGPAFLPWHRKFLLDFERDLQKAVGDDRFGLPYWDWTVDATLPQPKEAVVWSPKVGLGPDGVGPSSEVEAGPFVAAEWPIILYPPVPPKVDPPVPFPPYTAVLQRCLQRAVQAQNLPTIDDLLAAMKESVYDTAPWDVTSRSGFRNMLEGYIPERPDGQRNLHNRIHFWVGGSMFPMTSPNDPVFWLHHSFIDRVWAYWQNWHPTSTYLPLSGGPPGHNLNDGMWPWELGQSPTTPATVLDHLALGYSYDDEWAVVSGLLRRISMTSKGRFWGVNATNDVYRWTRSTWQPIPTKWLFTCRQVCASQRDDSVWALSTTGSVYTWNGKTWTDMDASTPGLAQLTLYDKNTAWAVSEDGEAYSTTNAGRTWAEHSTGDLGFTPRQFAYGNDKSLFALDEDGFRYVSAKDGSWTRLLTVRLAQLSVADASTMWGVDLDGRLWRTGKDTGGGSWVYVPGNFLAAAVAVARDGTLVAIDRSDKIYTAPGTTV